MKITIYELLGMIKEGKAPKKIKYKNARWYFNKKYKTYYMNNTEIELFYIEKITERLNDEVEIIEEHKIPEKMEEIKNGEFLEIPSNHEIMNKINEIIDYLEKIE